MLAILCIKTQSGLHGAGHGGITKEQHERMLATMINYQLEQDRRRQEEVDRIRHQERLDLLYERELGENAVLAEMPDIDRDIEKMQAYMNRIHREERARRELEEQELINIIMLMMTVL